MSIQTNELTSDSELIINADSCVFTTNPTTITLASLTNSTSVATVDYLNTSSRYWKVNQTFNSNTIATPTLTTNSHITLGVNSSIPTTGKLGFLTPVVTSSIVTINSIKQVIHTTVSYPAGTYFVQLSTQYNTAQSTTNLISTLKYGVSPTAVLNNLETTAIFSEILVFPTGAPSHGRSNSFIYSSSIAFNLSHWVITNIAPSPTWNKQSANYYFRAIRIA
jgi:hypothetical protein